MPKLFRVLSGALIISIACISAAGLAYVDANGLLPPPKAAVPSQADFDKWNSNAFVGSPEETLALYYESKLIAQHPGLARRNGRTLTVLAGGKPISTFKPRSPLNRGGDICILNKVLRLTSAKSNGPTDVSYVVCYAGEFDHPFLVLPDGHHWQMLSPSASPSGTLLVTGYSNDVESHGSLLTLYAWPSRKAIARFPAHCEVLGWHDDEHFDARCGYDPTPDSEDETTWNDTIMFDAKVWQDDSGEWQLQSVQGDLPENPAERLTISVPRVVSKLTPKKIPDLHFTATAPPEN